MPDSILSTDVLVYVGKVVGFVGIGGFADRIVAQPWRERLSEFIFGDRGVSLKDFESGLMIALVEPLCRRSDKGRLSAIRVAVFSIFWIGFTVAGDALGSLQHANGDYALVWHDLYVPMVAMSFAIAFPLDLWSVLVTKFLFYYRPAPLYLTALKILADAALSLVPIVCVFVVYSDIDETARWSFGSGGWGRPAWWQGGNLVILPSLTGVVALTGVQVVALISGTSLRLVTRLMAKPADPESVSAARKTPFTVMFASAALVIVIVDQLRKVV